MHILFDPAVLFWTLSYRYWYKRHPRQMDKDMKPALGLIIGIGEIKDAAFI